MIVDRARGNFSVSELGCNCCGTIRVSESFLDTLERLRDRTFPLPMLSVCRCLPHNQKEGGHRASLHLIDNPKHMCATSAGDINIYNRTKQEKLLLYSQAHSLGLSVGVKDSSMHVDKRSLVRLPQKTFFYGYIPEWFQ